MKVSPHVHKGSPHREDDEWSFGTTHLRTIKAISDHIDETEVATWQHTDTNTISNDEPPTVTTRKIGGFIVEGVSFLALMTMPLVTYLCETEGISFKRGFFCDDETIRFPYMDSTVPNYTLLFITISCPVVIVRMGLVAIGFRVELA